MSANMSVEINRAFGKTLFNAAVFSYRSTLVHNSHSSAFIAQPNSTSSQHSFIAYSIDLRDYFERKKLHSPQFKQIMHLLSSNVKYPHWQT